MTFRALSLELGVDSEWRRRETITDPAVLRYPRYSQMDQYRRFQETVGVRTEGDVGGERFMKFNFAGRWGLGQEAYDERRPGPDLHTAPHGDVLEYDGRITLFPAGKISANAWASRLDDRVPRPFLPSLDRRRETYGADLVYNDRVLPMRLAYEDSFERLTSQSP